MKKKNKAFKECVTYSGKTSQKQKTTQRVCDVEQPGYPQILSLGVWGAERLLFKTGVLRKAKDPKPLYDCWGCGQQLEPVDSKATSFKCPGGHDCVKRAVVNRSDYNFTAFEQSPVPWSEMCSLKFLKLIQGFLMWGLSGMSLKGCLKNLP